MNKGFEIIFAMAVRSLFWLAVLAWPASGSIIETGHDIQFTPLHRIDDDVYAIGGENISMDGNINGDFTAFTYGINVNGEINGNGNFFCRSLDHNGRIERNLHAFAETANINGVVNRSVIAFCSEFILSGNALVERDLTIYCGRVDIGGTVKGNAKIHGSEVRIFGIIEGNLEIEADKIAISSSAVIKGNLKYSSPEEIVIDTANGAVIVGTIERVPLKSDDDSESGFRTVVVTISELLAAFLFGLLILMPFRRYAKEAVEQLHHRMVVSLAAGLITTVVFLFAIVVVVLSSITFLIGYGLISGDTPAAGALVLTMSTIILPISAFSAVSGGILFGLGKIVLAFLVGYAIVAALKKQAACLSKTQLILGLIVLALIFEIPYFGVFLYLLGSLTGAGAIVLAIRKISFEIGASKSTDTSNTQ